LESAYGVSIGDVIDDIRDSMTSYLWRHNLQSRHIRKLWSGSTIRVDWSHTIAEHCIKQIRSFGL